MLERSRMLSRIVFGIEEVGDPGTLIKETMDRATILRFLKDAEYQD